MTNIKHPISMPLWERELPFPTPSAPFEPTLYAYPQEGAKVAVVIYPGGGYFQLSTDSEGHDVAKAYNACGFAAFVVKYRYKPCHGNAILADGIRALQLVRFHAADYGFSADKIAVCGFSAGGHLAMSVCEHDPEPCLCADAVGKTDPRPNACILGYPVVTLGDGTFPTMPDIFLGEHKEDRQLTDVYSYPFALDRMPPTFSFYSINDTAVDYTKNAEAITAALKECGTPAECHAFSDAAHGCGLGLSYPDFSRWFGLSVDFLKRTFDLQ